MSTLISELASAGEAELRVQLDDGVLERLLAYSRSVASFPTAVKEASQLHVTNSTSLDLGCLSMLCMSSGKWIVKETFLDCDGIDANCCGCMMMLLL